jgi:hypothetical protein
MRITLGCSTLSSLSWFSTEGNKENEGRGPFVAFVSFCSNLVFVPPLRYFEWKSVALSGFFAMLYHNFRESNLLAVLA